MSAVLSPTRAIGELYGALWRHAEGARGQLLGATGLLTTSLVLRLTLPWLAGWAINALQTGDIAGSGLAAAPCAGRPPASSVKKRHGPTRPGELPRQNAFEKSAMQSNTYVLRAGLMAAAVAFLVACSTTPLPPQRPLPSPPGATVKPPPPPPAPPAFIRPAAGATLSRFDGKANKGLDIAGSLGDPILAVADGRVVYVGGELRGYGNMVIVKHNDTFLSAYAHAQQILVKEKDVVRQGQKIAEMGSSGADRVKLHFELRKQGVAVDPEPYLNGQLR